MHSVTLHSVLLSVNIQPAQQRATTQQTIGELFMSNIQPPWAPFLPTYDGYEIKSISQSIAEHATARPNSPAVEFMGTSFSYKEMHDAADKFALRLKAEGIQTGETIAIHLPNIPQYLIALIAASRLACPVTGVSPLLTAPEIEHQLSDSSACVLITLDDLYAQFSATLNPSKAPSLTKVIVTKATDCLAAEVPETEPPSLQNLPVLWWNKEQPEAKYVLNEIQQNADDTVLIQYTGGTTGKPKGAELSLENLSANAGQSLAFLGFTHTDTVASAFPLFHMAGLAISMMALRSGARQLLIPDPRNVDHIINQMALFPPTMIGNVPSLYQMLMENPAFRELDFSQLRVAFSGAAPFSVDGIRQLEAIIGEGVLCEVYGMTEASPMMTVNPPGRTKPGTVGIPVPDCNLRIMDAETGLKEMAPGKPGEITLCGPQVMKGYRNRPDATAETIREIDGERWLYSGDIGHLDDEGYLTVSDRAKDMLIVSGYKVFSVELESKLKALSFIEHAAIIGKPDDARPGNEIVCLFVQTTAEHKNADPGVLKELVLTFCRGNLAPYKVPKQIEFVDALPFTAVGKLDKKKLRAELMAAT